MKKLFNNYQIKMIILLSIVISSFLGMLMISVISNLYTVNKRELLNKDTWFTKPNNIIVENTEDTFTAEEINNLKVSLTEQGLYYYNQLSDEDKNIFNMVYLSVQNRNKQVVFEDPISTTLLTKIVYILKFDCPEYYFLGQSIDYDLKGKKVTAYYPDYIFTEKQYNNMQNKINTVVEEIKAEVAEKTEYEAELFIHNYIVENTEYNTETSNCNNMYGCLIEGKANCEGYSAAFMYLLRQVGINSTQVIGEISYENETIGHSWNMVNVDGEYYYVDVSWDDLENSPEYTDIDYHYAFFNITYNEIIANRDISKNLEYLGEISTDNNINLNYYYKNGLYANSLAEAKTIIMNKLPVSISSKNKYFMIKCNGKEVYDELLNNIKNIMQTTINENKLAITKCQYIKIENGYTLIIHNIEYSK